MRISNRQARSDALAALNRIAAGVQTLAAPPAAIPIRQENHFHGELTPGGEHHVERLFERPAGTPARDIGERRAEVERENARAQVRELFEPEVTNRDARIAVLAVSLNLKNRLDAKRVIEGTQVLEVIDAYKRVQALRDLLGPVTDDELTQATALYDELAS